MADGLTWEASPKNLRRPLLVAGFEGWNDAADAASSAAGWLTQHGQSRRPQVELVDGVTRAVSWPENLFFTVGFDDRDLVVLRGIEPSYRWRSFCSAVTNVAHETGCEMVITLGALLADVPHTRAARITGTATADDLIARLGLTQSRYEGPTGIVGVLNDYCRAEGVPSVSLWAPVPHYLAAPPNPPATLALLERCAGLTGVHFDLERLEDPPGAGRVAHEVAAGDDDVRNYVSTLEERFDNDAASDQVSDRSWGTNLPSGDELAKEVERFLREQRDDT